MSKLKALAWATVALSAACGGDRSKSGGAPKGSSLAPARVTVFRDHSLTLARLELPTAAPLTVGSVVTDRLVSGAPDVVSIDAVGNLVAHRNGRAEIRSPDDPLPLVVDVQVIDALRAEPSRLTLRAGESQRIRLIGDDADVLPASVQWTLSDPAIARAQGLIIIAGDKPGTATLIAESSGREARVSVEVLPGQKLELVARNLTLAVGSIEQLFVRGQPGAQVDWTSSDASVLKPLRGGLFIAQARGEAHACARAGGQTKCVSMSVR